MGVGVGLLSELFVPHSPLMPCISTRTHHEVVHQWMSPLRWGSVVRVSWARQTWSGWDTDFSDFALTGNSEVTALYVLLMLCCGDIVSHHPAIQMVEVVAEPGLQKQCDLDSLSCELPLFVPGTPGCFVTPQTQLTAAVYLPYKYNSNSQPQANTNNNEIHKRTCTGEWNHTVV